MIPKPSVQGLSRTSANTRACAWLQVAAEAVKQAEREGQHVVLVDTAGRMQVRAVSGFLGLNRRCGQGRLLGFFRAQPLHPLSHRQGRAGFLGSLG